MRKKMNLVLIVALALLVGCSSNKVPKVSEKEITNVIECNKNFLSFAWYMSGVNNEGVYTVESENNTYYLCTYNDQGKLLKKISFDKGKGPGELYYPSYMFKADGYLWFHCMFLQTLSKFDLSGEFIDSYLLESTDENGTLGMLDGDIIYHGLGLTFLKKINLKTNEVIKSIEYDSKIKNAWINQGKWENNPVAGGCMLVDDDSDNIYI